ncbi:acyltransferase domain-containing protein [Streptomyces sp. B21-106]|uniref:acyltransferase domain-containing protein n=1 Tax=Streptomyces sp. B21-106 TaxID=3039418 RepID=UPI002FEE87FC
MDEAFRLLAADGPRLRREWLAEAPSADYDDVTVAQPLLYAVNHALGRMVLGWGVRPAAIIGHSVGEVAAATLAGILGFEDGIRLMRDRVVHFADTPPGGMLAVAASPDDVADLLGEDVHLAAVNAARQLLLAGEREPLARAARELDGRGVICRPVQARQAFHSPRSTTPSARPCPGSARCRCVGRPSPSTPPTHRAGSPTSRRWTPTSGPGRRPGRCTSHRRSPPCSPRTTACCWRPARATASAGWPAASPG